AASGALGACLRALRSFAGQPEARSGPRARDGAAVRRVPPRPCGRRLVVWTWLLLLVRDATSGGGSPAAGLTYCAKHLPKKKFTTPSPKRGRAQFPPLEALYSLSQQLPLRLMLGPRRRGVAARATAIAEVGTRPREHVEASRAACVTSGCRSRKTAQVETSCCPRSMCPAHTFRRTSV